MPTTFERLGNIGGAPMILIAPSYFPLNRMQSPGRQLFGFELMHSSRPLHHHLHVSSRRQCRENLHNP